MDAKKQTQNPAERRKGFVPGAAIDVYLENIMKKFCCLVGLLLVCLVGCKDEDVEKVVPEQEEPSKTEGISINGFLASSMTVQHLPEGSYGWSPDSNVMSALLNDNEDGTVTMWAAYNGTWDGAEIVPWGVQKLILEKEVVDATTVRLSAANFSTWVTKPWAYTALTNEDRENKKRGNYQIMPDVTLAGSSFLMVYDSKTGSGNGSFLLDDSSFEGYITLDDVGLYGDDSSMLESVAGTWMLKDQGLLLRFVGVPPGIMAEDFFKPTMRIEQNGNVEIIYPATQNVIYEEFMAPKQCRLSGKMSPVAGKKIFSINLETEADDSGCLTLYGYANSDDAESVSQHVKLSGIVSIPESNEMMILVSGQSNLVSGESTADSGRFFQGTRMEPE